MIQRYLCCRHAVPFRLLGLMFATAVFLPNASAFEAITKEAFLERYAPQFEKIVEVYSNMQMQVESVRTDWPAYNGAVRRVEFRIFAREKSLRADLFVINSGGGPGDDGEVRARVSNPGRSFRVQKAKGSDSFVLREIAQGGEQFLENIRLNAPISIAPFGIIESTIPDFLALQQIQVVGLDELPTDGGRAFRLTFTNRTIPGEFVFSESDGWVLKSYINGRTRATLMYEGQHDGIGLLKRVETWNEEEPGKKVLLETWNVSSIDPEPPSEEEFRLGAFGLPDVQEAGEQRLWTLYLLGALVLAAVGAVALYGRRAKGGA
jgi:hypothetical protein